MSSTDIQGHARRSPALGGHDGHAPPGPACQDARSQAVPPFRLDLAPCFRGAQARRRCAHFWRRSRPRPDERQAPRPRSPGGRRVAPRPADQGEDRVCPDQHQDPQAPGPQGGPSGDCEYFSSCFRSCARHTTRICHAYRDRAFRRRGKAPPRTVCRASAELPARRTVHAFFARRETCALSLLQHASRRFSRHSGDYPLRRFARS